MRAIAANSDCGGPGRPVAAPARRLVGDPAAARSTGHVGVSDRGVVSDEDLERLEVLAAVVEDRHAVEDTRRGGVVFEVRFHRLLGLPLEGIWDVVHLTRPDVRQRT